MGPEWGQMCSDHISISLGPSVLCELHAGENVKCIRFKIKIFSKPNHSFCVFLALKNSVSNLCNCLSLSRPSQKHSSLSTAGSMPRGTALQWWCDLLCLSQHYHSRWKERWCCSLTIGILAVTQQLLGEGRTRLFCFCSLPCPPLLVCSF